MVSLMEISLEQVSVLLVLPQFLDAGWGQVRLTCVWRRLGTKLSGIISALFYWLEHHAEKKLSGAIPDV